MLKLREVELLQLMINQEEYRPVHYFAKELGVSDKTIRNDLNNLEAIISDYNITLERVQGSGIRLIENTKNEVERLLSDSGNASYKEQSVDITSRRRQIIYYLLNNSDEYTSIQRLADEYYVSVSGIINDFKSIEKWLVSNSLELYKGNEGTKIIGEENTIRKALAQFILDFPTINTDIEDADYESRLDGSTRNKLLDMFESHEIKFFEEVISEIEVYLDINIVEPYFINLMTHLLISVERSKYSENLETREVTSFETSVYSEIVDYISMKVERYFNINYSIKEKNYILQFILGTLSIHDTHSSDDTVSKIVFSFINYMEEITEFDFMSDDVLIKGLMLHLQPMMNRVKYNIKISNPLRNELMERHESIFVATRFVLNYLMRDYFMKELTLDEISYLVIYLVASLDRRVETLNCVVVCHSGYGTSQLLTARLKKSFADLEITNVVSTNHMGNLDYSMVDMIISTVYIEKPPVPYLVVSALLDSNEKAKIREFINKHTKKVLIDDTNGYDLSASLIDKDTVSRNGEVLIYQGDEINYYVLDGPKEGLVIDKNNIYLVGTNDTNLKNMKILFKKTYQNKWEEVGNGLIKAIK